jgi:hypothetical protein
MNEKILYDRMRRMGRMTRMDRIYRLSGSAAEGKSGGGD